MAYTNDIRRGMIINYNGEPHIIIEREFHTRGKGAAFNRCKLKSIKTGKIIGAVFISGEKVEEVDVETKTMQFLYADGKDAYFMDPQTFDQIPVLLEQIPGGTDYLHTEGKYIIILYEGQAISLQLPNKLTLEVTDTSSASRGNTATNATKDATLETGVKVQVPLFINIGDKVVINTETGSYFSKES